MDEQNTQNPDPVTQPAGEASSPIPPQPEQTSVSIDSLTPEPIPEPAAKTGTAQMAGNEPLPTSVPEPLPPTLTNTAHTSEETPPKTEESPRTPTPILQGTAQPGPTPTPAQPVPVSMPAQAPVTTSPRNMARLFLEKAKAVIQLRKQKKLLKIMSLFEKKKHITNDEVEKLLHVSDATATHYLSPLEQQGKIKQAGKTVKGVTYTKN